MWRTAATQSRVEGIAEQSSAEHLIHSTFIWDSRQVLIGKLYLSWGLWSLRQMSGTCIAVVVIPSYLDFGHF
jgi:hypothetical protein